MALTLRMEPDTDALTLTLRIERLTAEQATERSLLGVEAGLNLPYCFFRASQRNPLFAHEVAAYRVLAPDEQGAVSPDKMNVAFYR